MMAAQLLKAMHLLGPLLFVAIGGAADGARGAAVAAVAAIGAHALSRRWWDGEA